MKPFVSENLEEFHEAINRELAVVSESFESPDYDATDKRKVVAEIVFEYSKEGNLIVSCSAQAKLPKKAPEFINTVRKYGEFHLVERQSGLFDETPKEPMAELRELAEKHNAEIRVAGEAL